MERHDWEQCEDYRRVAAVLRHLEAHHEERPGLDELAARVGLSKYHFHRLFTRWVGTPPHRFLQHLGLRRAQAALAASQSVLDASLEAGLSGPGRLHDLFVTHEALSPGEYKRGGEGVTIAYGFHPSPFGECLLALTERGVCGLAFVDDGGRDAALADLARRWPRARLHGQPERTASVARRIFGAAAGPGAPPLHLVLRGTNFQIQVWEALLQLPPGGVATYGEVAAAVGRPGAARAVGQAVARNPIGYLIPCHRVIRGMGVLGGYRWGTERKQVLLAWEAARRDGASVA